MAVKKVGFFPSLHLSVENALLHLLPKGGERERAFPSLGRIANLVDLSQKLIFEVQCSPISIKEVQKREEDYKKVGFQTIWILHDHTFNRPSTSLSLTELYIRKRSVAYYASTTPEGYGCFYDQQELFYRGERIWKSSPYPLLSLQALPLTLQERSLLLPSLLKERLRRFPLFFPGDLFDSLRSRSAQKELRLLEQSCTCPLFSFHSIKKRWHYLLRQQATTSPW